MPSWSDSRGLEKNVNRLLDQAGQAMVEFLVVLPVMLLLMFGAIQFALIFHAKITLNYAIFEAARAGTLAGADFAKVKEGFARGLAPLYSYPGDDDDQVAAFHAAREKVRALFDDQSGLVRIERLTPTPASFRHYAPYGEIPNDNLLYRSSSYGPAAGMSIQDANLLQLRVTYWYPLYVPLVNKLIASFICCADGENCRWANDPVCDLEEPYIPLTAVAALRMQTPARESNGYSE